LPPTTATNSGAVSRLTHWILVANVWAQTLILVTGAVVRLTSSGLGCPTWPTCTGSSWVPISGQVQGWHKYIEFGNRMLTGVLIVVAIAALVAVWWHKPKRKVLLWLAVVPLLGTFAQAVLGGITVRTHLNPWTVSAHFLVSIAIVYASVVLQIRGDEDSDGPIRLTVHPIVRTASWALLAIGGMVVVLGVVTTGSGPHAGDKVAARFGFDQRIVAWFHADVVLFFLGLLIGVVISLYVTNAPDIVKRRAGYIVIIAIAQGTIGYTQWFTGLPEALVAMHVAGAGLLWVFLVRYVLTTRTRNLELEPAAVQ
jgi:cytochrome c oxidase assembly protein subunit 15